MPDFKVVIEGGDLEEAHKALAGVGAYKLGPAFGGYGEAESEELAPLVVGLDAEDQDDAEGVVMAVLPPECEIAKVEEL